MVECRFLKDCPFFHDRMANMPTFAQTLKTTYCNGTSFKCARFLVAVTLGWASMPEDLFPNQQERAEKIIADTKHPD